MAKSKKKSNGLFWFLLVVGVLLIGTSFYFWWYSSPDQSDLLRAEKFLNSPAGKENYSSPFSSLNNYSSTNSSGSSNVLTPPPLPS